MQLNVLYVNNKSRNQEVANRTTNTTNVKTNSQATMKQKKISNS